MIHRRFFLTALAGVAFTFSAAQAKDAYVLHGSTTVMNAVMMPKKADIEAASGVKLEIVGNGSGQGMVSLVEGKADIAMISAPLESELPKVKEKSPAFEGKNLVAAKIGEAKLAFIVHSGNAVKTLTNEQIGKILKGEITNWKDVGGADAAIVIVAEKKGGGVRGMAEKEVLKGAEFAAGVREMAVGSQIAKVVGQTPAAIGEASSSSVDSSVVVLSTDKVIAQPLILVTIGEPDAGAKKIIDAATAAAK